MSHRAFATLWMQLEMRTDINNILQELIGQNSLESVVLPDDSDGLLEISLHLAVLLRVIFDLQRTYYQHPRSDSHCPYLLQPDQLLLAILYLLRLKSRVFRRLEDISEYYIAKRSFIAQTVVSGLRALWLSKPALSQQKKDQLLNKFRDAWESDRLNNRDEFLVRTVCAKIIDELTGLLVPSSDLATPACGKAQLRDYSAGLYFLEARTGDFVRPVRDASVYINRDKHPTAWFKNYWILFDIAWSTEAALIQLCVNASKPTGAKVIRPSLDDIHQLHLTRTNLLKHIFSPSNPIEPLAEESVAAVLFTACIGRNCTCLQGLRDQLNPPNASQPQPISVECKRGMLDNKMDVILNRSLARHAKVLENRKEELRDCNGELKYLSESLDTHMDAWYSGKWPIEATEITSRHAQRTAYILPCPNLHPIPFENLEILIKQSEGQVGLNALGRNSALLEVDIACEQCDSQYPIKRVRQIEPLRWLSATIRGKLRRRLSAQHEIQPWATDLVHQQQPWATDLVHRQREPLSHSSSTLALSPRSGTGSSTIGLSGKGTPMTGPLTQFFEDPPNKSSRQRAISYCFSADGNSLVLWGRNEAHVAFCYVNTMELEKFTISNIIFAAAGAAHCAVISQDENGRNLYVYQRGADESTREIKPDIPRAYCIAVSCNDRYVAVGFDDEAWVWVIGSPEKYCHKLRSVAPLHMNSQRINFSPQTEQIIVASRYSDGSVHTYIGECRSPPRGYHLQQTKIAKDDGKDYGLSSVLCDSNSSCVCITAFSRSRSPVLLSPRSNPQILDTSYSDCLGTQIQCAASSPSGQIFTLVNNENLIFFVRRLANGSDGQWSVKRVKARVDRKTVSTRENLMAVAMPDENTIHLFWISGAGWTLMTI